jgi:CheY-like chemotaxis protein
MPTSAADFKNLHILIVDDDTAMLDLIEALLKSLGVGTVSRATSGAEAFNLLAKTDKVIDCTLCDYTMANGNGLQLLQAIRMGQVKNCRPDACFVLLTASGDAAVVSVALELDVSGYIVKPATPPKLQAAITKARARGIKINFQKYGAVTIPQ